MVHSAATHVLRAGLILVGLLSALLLGSANAFAEVWQPLEVGHHWTYSISQTQRVELGGQLVGTEHKAGRILRDVVREGRRNDVPVPLFVVDDVRRWGNAEIERISTLTAERGGALLEYGFDQGKGVTIHPRPLIQVPAQIKGGLTWDVGDFALDGLQVAMSGEVLGLQNARTPAQTFERCLKVRYRGKVSGLVDLAHGRLPVRAGTFEVTQWFAPDVGLVLAEEDLTLELLTAQGVMTVRTEDEYALERFRKAGEGPVPARHP